MQLYSTIGFIQLVCLPSQESLAWLSCLDKSVRENYRQTSNIIRTTVGNKIVDHSDVVGTSPVGAAPTTSSFLT